MREICIVELSSSGAYSAVYTELICAISSVLQALNVRVSYQMNRIKPDVPNLVFAWYRAFVSGRAEVPKLPGNCVVFNLAPLTATEHAPWLSNYIAALAANPVIDYAYVNQNIIEAHGNTRNTLFQFGYHRLSAFDFPARHKHLVFYGKLTPYRQPILEHLHKAGVPIDVLSNVWGHERDLRIATATATLNIGKFEEHILEVYRIWHSLCLGTPVISERGNDLKLSEAWGDYVNFVSNFDQLSSMGIEISGPELYAEQTSLKSEVECLLEWIGKHTH